jgi:hypothetical protein
MRHFLFTVAILAETISYIAGVLGARADENAIDACHKRFVAGELQPGDEIGACYAKATNNRCDGSLDGSNAQVCLDWVESRPKPAATRFRPWQEIWQCNDIRVTVTMRDPNVIEYDLGGTIWGGSRFAKPLNGPLYFNGRPCLPLR